jgi:archaeosine-15-forming tRNA-guanine transglycosylase
VNINLCNSQGLTAVVHARPLRTKYHYRRFTEDGEEVQSKLVVAGHTGIDVSDDIILADKDIDLNATGMILTDTETAWANGGVIVDTYTETWTNTMTATVSDRKPYPEPNINTDIPVRMTGKYVKHEDAVRTMVFSRTVQLVHADDLQYKFLYDIAAYLENKNAMCLITAGKERLVFTSRGIPYVVLMRGITNCGSGYMLTLHCSNQELKCLEVSDAS